MDPCLYVGSWNCDKKNTAWSTRITRLRGTGHCRGGYGHELQAGFFTAVSKLGRKAVRSPIIGRKAQTWYTNSTPA